MKKINLNIKVEKQVKEEFACWCAENGKTVSGAIREFIFSEVKKMKKERKE